MKGIVFEVQPTVSTTPAYTAEDQVGGIMGIDGACRAQHHVSKLVSVDVVDQGKQKAALTVFIFDELPTVNSADNGAIDISDAEMADKCIAYVDIAATDYKDVLGNSVASKAIGVIVKSKTDAGKLYAVAKTTGTPTYVSTADLMFRFAFEQYDVQ